VLTAVVKTGSSGVEVAFLEDLVRADEEEGEHEEVPESDLNPIAPEPKELFWGFGSFVVLAVCLRYWLFPKVREGMQRRYDSIQADKEAADTLTAGARADVAEYEARLTSVRAEAQHKVEAARATLEAERTERLTAVNAGIAERRAAAAAEVEAARAEAMGDVEDAVADVVGSAASLALQTDGSTAVSDDVVRNAVRSAMGAEVSS
jgi:F-type H+-transporting ATPase subunit b